MVAKLLYGDAEFWIWLEQVLDDALALWCERNFLREAKAARANLAIRVIHSIRLKRRLTHHKGIEHDPHCPYIDLERMSDFS